MLDRVTVRHLLWWWGQTPAMCALMQQELDGLHELLEAAADLQPAKLSGMPSGVGVSDKTATAAEKLSELKSKFSERVNFLKSEIRDRQEFVEALDDVIAGLGANEREVLEYRYRRGFEFPEICAKLRYSRSQVVRIEGRAVDMFSKSVILCEIQPLSVKG